MSNGGTDDPVGQVELLLARCTPEQRREVFARLRRELTLHPLEERLNAPAEVILEAVARASDLTLRGIRGVLAEAAFVTGVVGLLGPTWESVLIQGDHPYDVLLRDGSGRVSVQVKLQRSERHQALVRGGLYVVEVQRTRSGTREGEQTRPYRYGEFDILAVCMEPATRGWGTFRYTPGRWLIPRPEEARHLRIMQPVPTVANEDWTDDLLTCVAWLRSDVQKRVADFPKTSLRRTRIQTQTDDQLF